MKQAFNTDTTPALNTARLHPHSNLPVKQVTLVIPAYNEADNLSQLIPRLFEQLQSDQWQLDLLVVDDGSEDDTRACIIQLANHYPVSLLQLSRNFGKESAISAGLAQTDSDAVVILDADGQHPPAIVREFITLWQQGYEVVIGQRQHRNDDPLWRRVASGLFYRMLQSNSKLPIVSGAGDFRLLDRRVVEVLNALPESDRFMKGLYSWAGFRHCQIPYSPQPRQNGESRFASSGLLDLALSALTSFGRSPLRPVLYLGCLILAPAIGWTAINSASALISHHLPDSGQWIGALLLWVISLQLLGIGVIGEYLHRILRETKQRPSYVVAHHHRSLRSRLTKQQAS